MVAGNVARVAPLARGMSIPHAGGPSVPPNGGEQNPKEATHRDCTKARWRVAEGGGLRTVYIFVRTVGERSCDRLRFLRDR